MFSQMDNIPVAARSAPIKQNPDGSCEWAGRDYPNYDAAYDARRAFRAITFGIVYGGGGLLGANT